MHPLHTYGGDGPTLHLAVANGFPPQTYTPLARALMMQYHVVTLPPRALWPGEIPPRHRHTWDTTVGRDLIDGIREHDLRDIIGIGHSFGGVATVVAADALPQRFSAVILLDPTILPPTWNWIVRVLGWAGRDTSFGQRASKRRHLFESRDAAAERLRGTRLFADWHDDAFQGYIDTLKPTGIDDQVTLAWPRAWEAYYFNTPYTYAWSHIKRLKVPVMAIRGATSDTFRPQAAEIFQRVLPDATTREIDGHGHLFPQTAPAQTAALILDWLEANDLNS